MRRVLTVFIASPSDLAAERKRTSEVVTEMNGALKKIDWAIDLLGWEDTLPGFGRPQALINRDVGRCDLFIGMLWRRWGTPPAQNSTFSSGFEEEFSIAKTRREQTPSPEIWMFFKAVEAAQAADPGAQLQHVIDFRESLIANKTVFFKEFEGIDAWEKMLREYLLKHVLGIVGTQRGAPEGPSERAGSPRISTEANAPEAPAAGRQLATLAHDLEPAFETGDLNEITAAISDADEVAFLAVRTFLLSAALVSVSGASATLLPAHELNTLYRYRDRLRATRNERHVLFKTILADDFDVKPGWYWFRDLEVEQVTIILIAIALLDDETTARERSFEILRRAHVPIFPPELQRELREIPSGLRDVAWAYLVDLTTPEDLKVLREWATGTWLESRVQWLQAWTETGRDLDAFLAKIPDPQLIPEPMKQSIRASIAQLADASLQALRSMPILDLSEAAAAELRRRGAPISKDESAPDLTGKLLAAFLEGSPNEPNSEVRETDDERYERLNRENSDGLRNSLNWYSVDSATNYQLLVERGEIARDIARKDLLDRFRRIRDEFYQRLEKAVGAKAAGEYVQQFEKYEEFLTRMFTAAALAALATEPTAEDVPVARRFLNEDGFRTAALRIVTSKGAATDVNDLINIARSSFGNDRELALEGVQRLTANKLETARTLITLGGREMRRAALSLVGGLSDQDAIPFLEELLSHEDADLRIAAVGQIRRRVDDERLAEILRKYTDFGAYCYYNVVAWFDRMIYAPAPISTYYRTELERKLAALDR